MEPRPQNIIRALFLWLSLGSGSLATMVTKAIGIPRLKVSALEQQVKDTISPRSQQQRLAMVSTWPGSHSVPVSEPITVATKPGLYLGQHGFHANSCDDDLGSDLPKPLRTGCPQECGLCYQQKGEGLMDTKVKKDD